MVRKYNRKTTHGNTLTDVIWSGVIEIIYFKDIWLNSFWPIYEHFRVKPFSNKISIYYALPSGDFFSVCCYLHVILMKLPLKSMEGGWGVSCVLKLIILHFDPPPKKNKKIKW